MDEPILASVAKLQQWKDPLRDFIWVGLDSPLSEYEVFSALEDGELEPMPFSERPAGEEWNREDHAARIAYLVRFGWEDPIWLDVGVPGMGPPVFNPVVDGHHRLAAAIIRGDEWIPANASGSLTVIDWLQREPRDSEDLVFTGL